MTVLKETVKKQVPGYYRQPVGELMVSALYDGFINLSTSLFHGLPPEELRALSERKHQAQSSDGVPTAVTTYLIEHGSGSILLNAGGSKRPAPGMGCLPDSLAAAGCRVEDISAILLTHLHFDHVCGLVHDNGAAVFPRAKIYVSKAESDFWLNPQIAQAAPEGVRPFFEMAVNSIAPYKERGDLIVFEDGAELFPGIRALPTPGHTPGHTSFLISSGRDQLLLWGDIVHSHALQFSHPEVTNDFDSDQAQAAATRQALFKKVFEEKLLVAGDHLPFPGFGHMSRDGAGYQWVPVEYSWLPTME